MLAKAASDCFNLFWKTIKQKAAKTNPQKTTQKEEANIIGKQWRPPHYLTIMAFLSELGAMFTLKGQ